MVKGSIIYAVLGEKFKSMAQLTNGQKWTRVRCTCRFLPLYSYITFLYSPKIFWLRLRTQMNFPTLSLYVHLYMTKHKPSAQYGVLRPLMYLIFSFQYLYSSRTRVVEAAYLDGQECRLYKRPRRPESEIWNQVFKNSDLKWGLQMRWLNIRGLVKLLWLVTGKHW
jgi:hypothetical protein